MKKILFIANSSRGLYKFRKELVKELIEKKYKIYFTTPLLNEEFINLLEDLGANYHEITYSRRGTNIIEELKILISYLKLIKNIKPDMIITYTMKCNIYGSLAARIMKIPSINTVTGLGKPFEQKGLLKSVLSFMMKASMKKSKAVFFQNTSDLNTILKGKVLREDQCILVNGSGVNLEEFKPLPKKINDNKIRFLFIGRMVKHKGIEELLDVVGVLKKRYTNIVFQFLGQYDGCSSEKRIDEMLEKKEIEYLGISTDVRHQIKECDCVLLPSYTEGMSNVLLESGAMGKPLIATDIPGCREIVKDNENGFLVEAKNSKNLEKKIEEFINLDFSIKQEMGAKSRELIKNRFDRKKVIEKYVLEICDNKSKDLKVILEVV